MNETQPMRLGISTCPNDTFAFHGLLTRQVDWRGLEFDVELLDIQELNSKLFANQFDIAKASFHAALWLADRYVVLPSGSALGFGVGPLLLAARPSCSPDSLADSLTLCPGEHTTATLLFRLFYGKERRLEQTLFSEIMPRLQQQSADFGVCIHEGRFTWQSEGLALVEDLGSRWESLTRSPLPLGGILANRRLPPATLANVQAVIRDSIEYGLADPSQTLPTMRRYAQEFADEVLMQHVRLYVNEWTVDLGDVGQQALNELSRQALASGVMTSGERLEILTIRS